MRIRIAMVSAMQASAFICTEPKDPCLPWLVNGETYKVELVKRYAGVDESEFQPATPYNRYQYPELTCGEGLDLREGSVIHMTSAGKQDGDETERCQNGCYDVRAEPKIAGVVRTGATMRGRSIGDYLFSDRFAVMIGDACQADYTVGISPVSQYFIDHADQQAPTDYMIYRMISTPNPEVCVVPGSQILERSGCWDSWYVRITDAKGKVLTTDLPPKTNDAGANMSIANDEDGGL